MENEKYGLLVDYEFCTGCHSCEMACKVEHGLDTGNWGVMVKEIGPQKIGEWKWDYHFIPVPTALCDLCADRVEEGRWPTCVHHCQAQVLYYGKVTELAAKMNKQFMALYTPTAN